MTASRGVSTIGSPFTLKDVLIQHWNAGQCFEFLQQAIQPWIGFFADGLHACSAADMDDRRNPVAPFRADNFCDQHERRILLALEHVLRPFGQYDRRERPEGLAVLDPLVQDILHFGLARVRQHGAVAQRTRSEFGGVLERWDLYRAKRHSVVFVANLFPVRWNCTLS
jgi:hypothetical protein